MANKTFKITVEFTCPDMIDSETLRENFDGDAMAAYKFISDDFKEPITSFSTEDKILTIKVI